MAVAGALGAACDQGTQHDQVLVAPPLTVVGTNVDTTKAFPANGSIQIAFDRLLHPATAVRQSFLLSGGLQPTVQYDPVTRIVSLSTSSPTSATPWLTPGQTYSLTLPIPAPGALNSGPRAIDGATLTTPYTIEFIVGPPDPAVATAERAVDFCADVIPIFQNRCSGGKCHATPLGSQLPAEGLILQTPDGVANTAIARASQESNTGARAGVGLPAQRLFGVDMPIVDPLNPGNSWLMYKLLLARTRPVDQGLDGGAWACGRTAALPAPALASTPTFIVPLADDEKTRLGQFVLGSQMPFPVFRPADQATPQTSTDDETDELPCTFDEMERIRAWISQGATTAECPLCPG